MSAPFIRWSRNDVDAPEGEAAFDVSLMGGKGFYLYDMCARDFPVPPGFTITTAVARLYQRKPEMVMQAIAADIDSYLDWLYDTYRKQTGAKIDPLLSVRSGAPVSMPGMMDTVLNIGLTPANINAWRKTLSPRAAWDCMRRLRRMYGEVVLDIPKEKFDFAEAAVQALKGVDVAHMNEEGLVAVCSNLQGVYDDYEKELPDTPQAQVLGAIEAVFQSWNNPRAVMYRDLHGIPHDLGTAVNVQAMVFGNLNDASCTGVLFTRDPSTGEKGVRGEFMINAQGEDVVAGTHTPKPFGADKQGILYGTEYPPLAHPLTELMKLARELETIHADMQDIEFTIQDGVLFLLQTRTGKRSARAAFRIASELLDEGAIDLREALRRVTPRQYALAQVPTLDLANSQLTVFGGGVAASVGVVHGVLCRDLADITAAKAKGQQAIYVAPETTPDDLDKIVAADGIITLKGGLTSHAAVVARGMDKACIVGFNQGEMTTAGLKSNATSPEPVIAWASEAAVMDAGTGNIYRGTPVIAAGGDDVHIQRLITAAADESDVYVRASRPRSGAHVVFAEHIEAGSLTQVIQDASTIGLENAILDFRPLDAVVQLGTADEKLLDIVGAQETLHTKAVINGLTRLMALSASFKNCSVVLPRTGASYMIPKLKKAGFMLISEADTLEQALSLNGMILPSPRLSELAGSPDAMEALTEFLCSKGVTFGTIDSQSEGGLAISHFGLPEEA